jgi:hypothetical protein
MSTNTEAVKERPHLRILPKEPRPWREVWREAYERTLAEKGAA